MTNEEAIKFIEPLTEFEGNEDYIRKAPMVSNIETVEALKMAINALQNEIPQGEWIFKNGKYRCSHCGEKAIYGFNGACSIKQTELLTDFCWKCGAKMFIPIIKRIERMEGGAYMRGEQK